MKDVLLEELRFSASLALSGVEVVPRFRVLCPSGDFTVFLPLPDDLAERQRRMGLMYAFMAWKSASGFVLSSELIDPEAILCAYVGEKDLLAVARALTGKPRVMGPVDWVDPQLVGDEVIQLLPRGKIELDIDTLLYVQTAFGEQGEFETRRNN